MKANLAVIILVGLAIAGCSQSTPAPAPQPERYVKQATAVEAFELRSVCAKLADKLDASMLHGSAVSQTASSNYSLKTNRCYVKLDTYVSATDFGSYLYDGQTRDLLANAGDNGRGHFGMISDPSYHGPDGLEDGSLGFNTASSYIDEHMGQE